MMSEPLQQPKPPHAMGMNGKGSVKRKLDRNPDGSGGEEESSGAKRKKEDDPSKKKSRNANGIPKGFQIKQLGVPGSSQGKDRSTSQDPSQPSTSYAFSPSQPLSPPPNRHPVPPPNPDDRPLPKPKQVPYGEPSNPPTSVRTNHPAKPPSSSNRDPIKPPSHRGNGAISSFSIKGKERAYDPDVDSAGTPEEIERLEQLQGEINSIDDGRQESRRKATTPNPSIPISITQIHQTPTSSSKPNSSGSAASSGSRHGLHDSTNTILVPLDDTPMIQKNRELRHEQTIRRKSSIGLRSVRVSESFGAGILANPHPSVEFANFYTHISPELPEALRIRQLLVWCSSRAQVTLGSTSGAGPSNQAANAAGSPALPALSTGQEALLREIQDDFMKSLCLGKVDTSLPVPDGTPGKRKKRVKQHPRNIVNRAQEAEFLKQEETYKWEDTAWSETLQALNNQQANVFTATQSRTERRKTLEEEFDARWQAEKQRSKGKDRADSAVPGGDEEDDPEGKKEARLLSAMWDVPTDVFRGDDGVVFAESVRLVEEERRLKTRKGGLDEREEALVKRMGALEGLVDEIHQGAHTATVFAKHIDSHLTTFTKALASRFNARIPIPPLSDLPVPPLASESASTNPITTSALITAMQPHSVLSTTRIPDAMAKFSILSTAKVAEAESDAAKKAALDAEMGVAQRKITAIPATPSSRRTPRKSVGKK
ncbi:hypothetical protein FRB93_010685 [Tulasnella sp. JGI-2019a]|nr:hypothetical protein FRB93_010685 [Tulasnella sp. JGI-2019a]